MSTRSTVPGCGVTFEVVSNIPGVSECTLMLELYARCGNLQVVGYCAMKLHVIYRIYNCVNIQDAQSSEDREMLARMAANTENPKSSDNEAAIEKYLRSVLAVENILTLDRLRQVRYPSLNIHQQD